MNELARPVMGTIFLVIISMCAVKPCCFFQRAISSSVLFSKIIARLRYRKVILSGPPLFLRVYSVGRGVVALRILYLCRTAPITGSTWIFTYTKLSYDSILTIEDLGRYWLDQIRWALVLVCTEHALFVTRES